MASVVGVTHREAMMREWGSDSRIFASGHYEAAKRYSFWNDVMGFAVVFLTAFAGSTVFANLGTNGHDGWRLLAGSLSMATSILAAEKKYLRLEERDAKQQEAGRAHQSLLNEIEFLMSKVQDGAALADADVERIRNRRDEIEKSAPTIPAGIYRHCREKILKCGDCPRKNGLPGANSAAT